MSKSVSIKLPFSLLVRIASARVTKGFSKLGSGSGFVVVFFGGIVSTFSTSSYSSSSSMGVIGIIGVRVSSWCSFSTSGEAEGLYIHTWKKKKIISAVLGIHGYERKKRYRIVVWFIYPDGMAEKRG